MPPTPTIPKKSSLFKAFVTYPAMTGTALLPGETVVLVLRAHPITQITWVFNTFALVILLILIDIVLPLILNPSQVLYFNIFAGVMIFAYAWFNFLHWFYNVGVVTTQRILDIDFTGATYKEVSEARLDKVEEVTNRSAGYFGTLFNYGNVFVQTAGELINIEFINIPYPADVVKIINDLVPA